MLRPPALRQAIDAFYERGHSAVLTEEREKDRTALREVEDAGIRDAVQRQIDLGLDVVTDGGFRRWMFMNSFYDAVSGVRTGKSVAFRNDRDEDVELAVHEIVAPLQQIDSPAAREAVFMAEATRGYPFKVTFPAASIFFHPFTTVDGAYGSVLPFPSGSRAQGRRRPLPGWARESRSTGFWQSLASDDVEVRYAAPIRTSLKQSCVMPRVLAVAARLCPPFGRAQIRRLTRDNRLRTVVHTTRYVPHPSMCPRCAQHLARVYLRAFVGGQAIVRPDELCSTCQVRLQEFARCHRREVA